MIASIRVTFIVNIVEIIKNETHDRAKKDRNYLKSYVTAGCSSCTIHFLFRNFRNDHFAQAVQMLLLFEFCGTFKQVTSMPK